MDCCSAAGRYVLVVLWFATYYPIKPEQNLTAGVQLDARYPVLWLSFDYVWQPGEYLTKLVQLRVEHEPVACEQLLVLIVRELLLWIDIALLHLWLDEDLDRVLNP